MLTHGSLLANLEQAQRHPGRAVVADDVVLGVLPLFHIFGLNVVLGLTLYAGASVVLVERFDPVSALETIVNHKVTIVLGAPPMFTAWATMPATELEEAGESPMAAVRLALTGAAPLTAEVGVAFEQRYDLALRQGYGLTEASPIVTSSVIDGDAEAGVDRRASAGAGGPARRRGGRGRASRATPARSGCAAPTCSPVTGRTRRPPPRRSTPKAGCIPATSRSPTTTASSTSSTAPRTSSSCRASTCTRPRSRRRCSTTPASRRSR